MITVSTRSRAEAAAKRNCWLMAFLMVLTHSRAEAAASGRSKQLVKIVVSTHSRAKAAAQKGACKKRWVEFQHTAARRRLLWALISTVQSISGFQHTAARRRLLFGYLGKNEKDFVSTHSRTKAAARWLLLSTRCCSRFNTQPREGGCLVIVLARLVGVSVSTHSRAKAAAGLHSNYGW